MSKKDKHAHEEHKDQGSVEKSGTGAETVKPLTTSNLPDDAAYAWAGEAVTFDSEQTSRLTDIRLRVEAHLSGHRLAHSISVSQTAGRLAASHGVDPYLACAAGLLHDWDKKLTDEQLWAKVDAYGIYLPDRDPRMTPILHGITASRSLPTQFDLPPEVFRAISRHTIGAPDMSDLDIVIYCADMLEPLRGPQLDGLRSLAAGSLDELFAACVRDSLLYVLQRGRYIYPPNIDVYNAYLSHMPSAH